MKQKKWMSILTGEKDAYEKTCILGREILQALDATGPESAQSGQKAYDSLRESMKGAKAILKRLLPENTFIQYLSRAAASFGTSIFCEGRKQGYYVRQEEPITDDEIETASADKQRGNEYLLYPVAVRWLRNHQFRAKNVAANKKNGKWGNPDVLGVRVNESPEEKAVELVSIECKNSLTNWKQQIFEAVAHKRFADRAYFAFVLPVDEVEKRYEELVEFAEFYGVGLLVLEMEQEVLNRYNQKDIRKRELARLKQELALLEFREIYRAPRNHCMFQARKDYLEKGLKVTTMEQLQDFGEDPTPVGGGTSRSIAKLSKNGKKKQKKGGGGVKGGK